jgi:hypothetical protein
MSSSPPSSLMSMADMMRIDNYNYYSSYYLNMTTNENKHIHININVVNNSNNSSNSSNNNNDEITEIKIKIKKSENNKTLKINTMSSKSSIICSHSYWSKYYYISSNSSNTSKNEVENEIFCSTCQINSPHVECKSCQNYYLCIDCLKHE